MEMGRQLAKAQSAIPVSAVLPADSKKAPSITPEQKAEITEAKAEADKQKVTVQKLDKEYSVLLAEWKKQYPGDAVIFDSSSRVDIPSVQKVLKDDQIALQYILLPDKLIIMAITKDKIDCKSVEKGENVEITRGNIEKIIKRDFLSAYIEAFGHGWVVQNDNYDNEHFRKAIEMLNKFYKWMIVPIEDNLKGKKRIYIITDGFLSQVPFCALVSKIEAENIVFLVENYDIAYVRPSFIISLTKHKQNESLKTLLAVGNPQNEKFSFLSSLPGAENEVNKVNEAIKHDVTLKDIQIRNDASENWLKNKLNKSKYEIIYFATHGMPHAETYMKIHRQIKPVVDKHYAKLGKDDLPAEKMKLYKMQLDFANKQLPGLSPLNGFLLMSSSDNEDGFLTIKEILQIPDKHLESTKYVILSACNTGVTFSPSTLDNDDMIEKLSSLDIQKELKDLGWVPGQDQVSFVDSFMRRGINNVYGTLWFADDMASAYLLSHTIETIMKQEDKQDAVVAFSEAQRLYIDTCKKGKKPMVNVEIPEYSRVNQLHPYYWAVGAIFGK
jgi:CHAT domain-containing protein